MPATAIPADRMTRRIRLKSFMRTYLSTVRSLEDQGSGEPASSGNRFERDKPLFYRIFAKVNNECGGPQV